MPSDIVAAVDETAANTLFLAGESAANAYLALHPPNGTGSLGPLGVHWAISPTFSGGTVALAPPDTVAINHLHIDFTLTLTLSIDLSFLDFCLPQLCIPTPWGDWCTPKICFTFPTISVSVPFSSSVTLSADFGIDVHLTSGDWFVDIVIQSIPQLDLGAAALALLTAIGAAISLALLAVPFIGPILAIAVGAITAAFGLADVLGLLGSIFSLFLDGLSFNIYKQPQNFQILAASPPYNPAVSVTLTSVAAGVQASNKNELVLSVDI